MTVKIDIGQLIDPNLLVSDDGSGGPAGGDTNAEQTQNGHGFSALTPVYHDGSLRLEAQADNPATLGTHIVVSVVDANNFVVAQSGLYEITGHGLTPGEYYFTDPASAGSLVTPEPVSGYSNPIVLAIDANNLWVLPWRANLIGVPSSVTLQAVTDNGNTTTNDLEVVGSLNGVILESPDSTRRRVTVDNTGALITNIV